MSAGSADDKYKAQNWRWLAAEARIMAATMSDPWQKATMLSIAEAYTRLAERRDARQLIDTTSFGPEAMKVIGRAFDTAWAECFSRSRGGSVEASNCSIIGSFGR